MATLTPDSTQKLFSITRTNPANSRKVTLLIASCMASLLPEPVDEVSHQYYLSMHSVKVNGTISSLADIDSFDYRTIIDLVPKFYRHRHQFKKPGYLPPDILGIKTLFDQALVDEIEANAIWIISQENCIKDILIELSL